MCKCKIGAVRVTAGSENFYGLRCCCIAVSGVNYPIFNVRFQEPSVADAERARLGRTLDIVDVAFVSERVAPLSLTVWR